MFENVRSAIKNGENNDKGQRLQQLANSAQVLKIIFFKNYF